jgi:predicted phosphodiesterase
MSNKNLKRVSGLINEAVSKKKTINQVCLDKGLPRNTVSNFIYNLDNRLQNGTIDKKEYSEIKKAYDNYLSVCTNFGKSISNKSSSKTLESRVKSQKSTKPIDFYELTDEEKVEVEYDAYADDSYDDRSDSTIVRDSEGKIKHYTYRILIKNQPALEGILTREEMDMVYRLYSNMDGAGLTLRAVSREFKNLTFRDFKRILRAFNITKSSIPVAPHVIEESSQEDVMTMIFRNKEDNLFKKLEDERSRYFEKSLKEAHKQIIELKTREEWVEDIVNKYIQRVPQKLPKKEISKKQTKSTLKNPLFVIFGDVHFGKKFDNAIYGRGYNKDIARERIMQIAEYAVNEIKHKGYGEVVLLCLGDLVESILEDGMHPNHRAEMDLFQEEQIFFAVDCLSEMVTYIQDNTDSKITFYSIHGNHDRIGMGRDEDKNRTAGKIISTILKREVENKRVEVIIPKNNLLRIVKGRIGVFGQHGDATLSKKKPSELVNLWGEPGCFSVLIQGHWHSLKTEEGTNYIAIKVPSIASTDKYVMEELGHNNLPGFIIGSEPDKCYGFDYKKVTLY